MLNIFTRPEDILPRLWKADVVGLDTETTNNFKDRSVIGTSKLFCGSVAWRNGSEIECGVFMADELDSYREWLESNRKKVGHSLWHYETHVFANVGVTLRGQHMDTLTAARLLDTNRTNDLKAWGKRLGFRMTKFKELTAVTSHSCKVRSYKTDRVKDGVTYTAGAEFQTVNFTVRPMQLDLDVLWELAPHKRKAILYYAAEDAVVHVALYEHLVRELKEWKV